MQLLPVGQLTQLDPLRPHLLLLGTLQIDAEQHPLGQLLGEQAIVTHCPPMHFSVVKQATQSPPPVPQAPSSPPARQAPIGSRHPPHARVTHRPLSQRCPAVHVRQNLPRVPQDSSRLLAVQVPSARQQPFGQRQTTPPSLPASTTAGAPQTWLVHTLVPSHRAQLPPIAPHATRSVPVWHSPLASQQPSGQVEAEHGASGQPLNAVTKQRAATTSKKRMHAFSHAVSRSRSAPCAEPNHARRGSACRAFTHTLGIAADRRRKGG